MDEETIETPSVTPFLGVVIKREDDVASVAEEGEELVHLNDEVDEEEVYGDYSCQKCGISFRTWNMLKIHMKRAHEAIQCFKCRICSRVYNKAEAFELHVRSDHGRDDEEADKCLETLTLYRVSRGTSLYTRIKRKYSTRKTYSIADNPEMSCSQCDYKTKNKTSLAKHVAKHVEEARFSCEMCGRKFKIRRNLTYHIRYGHRDESCICDVCGKTCANNGSLEAHRKFGHFEGKFQCKMCNRLLISQENLDTHMLRQHVQRKPPKPKPLPENFVCEACGKVFSRADKLKRHTLVHTGEKPYVCAVCKETFARKNSLTQHLLLHTGAKPYVCDICGKAFAQKPGLSGHRRSHPGLHPPLPPVFIGPILEDFLKRCEQ